MNGKRIPIAYNDSVDGVRIKTEIDDSFVCNVRAYQEISYPDPERTREVNVILNESDWKAIGQKMGWLK